MTPEKTVAERLHDDPDRRKGVIKSVDSIVFCATTFDELPLGAEFWLYDPAWVGEKDWKMFVKTHKDSYVPAGRTVILPPKEVQP